MTKTGRQIVGRLLVTNKLGELLGILTDGGLVHAVQVRMDLGLKKTPVK